jgi:hypothetical protein
MKTIPKKFYHGDSQPTARNVGELKAILNELPDELRIDGGWGNPAQVLVYNHGKPDMHLSFEEAEESDDE